MVAKIQDDSRRIPHPTPEQPGTLGQQLAALVTSLYLGQRRGTPAAKQWQDARRLVIPHARRDER